MRTAHLPTVSAPVYTNQHGVGVYSEVQIEQVLTCLEEFLYSEVQYIMGNGHIPKPLPPSAPPREQTATTENITFQQLHWRAGRIHVCLHVCTFKKK